MKTQCTLICLSSCKPQKHPVDGYCNCACHIAPSPEPKVNWWKQSNSLVKDLDKIFEKKS